MLVKKNKKVKIFAITAAFCFVLAGVFFILSVPSFAQVNPGLAPLEETLGPVTDIRIIIARIIRIFLGLLGTVAVVLVLYGGYLWMTAAGNEEKITTAKQVLINASIGLGIIFAAFAITQFILNALLGVTGLQVPTGDKGGGDPGVGGTLGYGIVESHFPSRNDKNIARNTKVVVTFKEAMNPASLIDDADGSGVRGDSIGDRAGTSVRLLLRGDDLETGTPVAMSAQMTEDQRTFVFKPTSLLGSASQSTEYKLFLTNQVQRADGKDAFELRDACEGERGYCWDFEVSTFTDTTPPKVESVVPRLGETVARNVVVQMNFNEAIDPISATGTTAKGFGNIAVTTGGNSVAGLYRISNGYRTVEFTTEPNGLCGVNSCGGNVYCLPAMADMSATIKAAGLSPTPPEASFPYNGAVDMASNSLDGNGDGKANGQPGDNYAWSFKTNDTIDLVPPKIETLRHSRRDGTVLSASSGTTTDPASLVHLELPLDVVWSKIMMMSTLKSPNVALLSSDATWYGWFHTEGGNVEKEAPTRACADANDCTATHPLCTFGVCAKSAQKTTVELRHGAFFEDTRYTPSFGTEVKDIYQNCFYDPALGKPQGPVFTGQIN